MSRRLTTAEDAKNEIITAIESGDVQDARAEFDVDAIFDATYAYRVDRDSRTGQELLNTAGFEDITDHDTFWSIVYEHAR